MAENEIDTLLDFIRDLDFQIKHLKQEEQRLLAETAKQDPIAGAQTLLELMENVTGDELITLRSKLRLMISELIEVIYVRMERNEHDERWLYAQVHFRNGLIRRVNMVAFMTYSGGGSTNPKPELVSTSVSTPQIELKRDLRDPHWKTFGSMRLLAGLPVNRRLRPE